MTKLTLRDVIVNNKDSEDRLAIKRADREANKQEPYKHLEQGGERFYTENVVVNVDETPSPSDTVEERCQHCGYPISQRNPSGYCDHLYYPENCKTCSASVDHKDEKEINMNKDWKKEFDAAWEKVNTYFKFQYKSDAKGDYGAKKVLKDFYISQIDLAEKRGVDKTNKRWRERIIDYFAGAGELWFDYIGLTKEEQKQAAIDELSDLLKG